VDVSQPIGREILAEAILSALPRPLVVAAIASAAGAVLRCHAGAKLDPELVGQAAREIGNNAAQTLLVLLEVEPDPGNDRDMKEA